MERKQLTEIELTETEFTENEFAGNEYMGSEFTEQEFAGSDFQETEFVGDVDRLKQQPEKDSQTIILKVDENNEEDSLDLLSVMENMGRRWRVFRYVLVIAVCIGFLAAAAVTGVRGLFGEGSYARAVVSFSFDGIDEGLDPNGGIFDVNKIKSTLVIDNALADLGWTDQDVEEIRANLKLEGVIPDSVKQQIAVINTVAEDAAEYYTNIEDLDYFPSRYTVTLQRCKGMSGSDTSELLNAILLSYKEFFMDSYADMSVLGTAVSVLNVESYDYLQAADMIENGIDTMEAYVTAKQEQAPDFRANSTGLSFSDLANSIDAVRQLDLNNFISFVQSNNLTKDAGVQVDYYSYQIRQYNLEIQELQSQLADVERTIQAYEKDPVIVMSNQDSVTETSQKNEYYDRLLANKLELNRKISVLNTSMNRAYEIMLSINNNTVTASEEDYNYANDLLQGLLATVDTWSGLVQKTAAEYYETKLYASAYRIAIPAQYTSAGGVGDLIKAMLLGGGAAALLVIVIWGIFGIKEEIVRVHRYETYTDDFSDMD